MLFSKSIVIPANTSKALPLITKIPICEGLLNRVWVRWRWGSGNLCGCRILYESFQVWPLSMTEWFVSNVQDIVFDESFRVDDVPHVCRVESYNLDDTFPHTLWVAFAILRAGQPFQVSELLSLREDWDADG